MKSKRKKRQYRVYIEQVNQTFVIVNATDPEAAKDAGYRKWRREDAHSRILSVVEHPKGAFNSPELKMHGSSRRAENKFHKGMRPEDGLRQDPENRETPSGFRCTGSAAPARGRTIDVDDFAVVCGEADASANEGAQCRLQHTTKRESPESRKGRPPVKSGNVLQPSMRSEI